MADNKTLLLIGGSGYLGSLVAANLLAYTNHRIVAPLRTHTSRETLIEKIQSELTGLACEIDFERLITVDLPSNNQFAELLPSLRKFDVQEIIHCAGSVDYFDSDRLKEVNIDLTNELIALGQKQQVEKFIYLSTAFSSGYLNDFVTESLHSVPVEDPTEYTKSKRDAEILVANSSLPYLIVRPSIVIGDSRTGQYPGKPYGLYQLWTAFEKFICDRYKPKLYFVSPQSKLQLLHQDAFANAFLAAREQLPNDSIINLVSKHESLPTTREVVTIWSELFRPQEVNHYDCLADVPLAELDRRSRMWLEFAAVNNNIATHPWKFETTNLDKLRANGLQFNDATINTVRVCQDAFIGKSTRIAAYLRGHEQWLADNAFKSENVPVVSKI
jgi:nucleoside-diphosphate-sugar epimerase